MENDTGTTSSRGDTGIVAEQVQRGAQDVAQQAQQAAGQALQSAQSQAKSAAHSGKSTLADRLDTVQLALQTTSSELNNNGQGQIAGVVDTVAQRIDTMTTYLRNTPIDGIVRDAEDFARAQTPLFLGGAFVLGFLATRFLKSSPDSSGSSQYDGSYAQGAYGSSGGYAGTPTYTRRTSGTANTGMSGQYETVPSGQGRFDDVSGMPEVENRYAPGLMGEDDGTAG